MLITISGMVGSGKSTTAALAIKYLEEAGHRPSYLRFRYLKILGFSRPARRPDINTNESAPARQAVRGTGFRLRRLTAARTAGYLVRILAFRMSRASELRCAVVDRYFYDNFVQYRLQSRRERFYAAVLRRTIPEPDVALVLIARDDTISARRSNYDRQYVMEAGRRYRELPALFPNLVRVETDPGADTAATIRQALSRFGVS